MNDKFKAHKWWLPSAGELARICYYKLQGQDYSNNQAIFAKALNMGILSFTTNTYSSTSTESDKIFSWAIQFSNGEIARTGHKNIIEYVRAVAAF